MLKARHMGIVWQWGSFGSGQDGQLEGSLVNEQVRQTDVPSDQMPSPGFETSVIGRSDNEEG